MGAVEEERIVPETIITLSKGILILCKCRRNRGRCGTNKNYVGNRIIYMFAGLCTWLDLSRNNG